MPVWLPEMERPTVLHLHLARVILLTPFRQIAQLTNLTTGETALGDDPDIAAVRKHAQRWALGRLAQSSFSHDPCWSCLLARP
jgi:hypothetical protein